jgi:hypothetical protein
MKASSVIGGLAGTAAMTAFSYAISKDKKENFKEPKILGQMIYKAVPQLGEKKAQVAGWVLHLTAGFVFSAVYRKLLIGQKPTFLKGMIYGGTSGIPAVLLWNTLFEIHPNPPKDVEKKKYFGHLLVAHIVFGGISFLVFRAKKQLTGKA